MSELRLLRYAIALGNHGNYARAAADLGISQPALSRAIATLERELDARLFDRAQKGVTPTPFGRVLLERADIVLKRDADIRREIDLLKGLEAGTLAVAAGPYPAESVVARALATIVRLHPRLHVHCVTADPADVVHDVLREAVDIGVAAIPPPVEMQRLEWEPIDSGPVFLACRPGHPLTRQAAPTREQVLRYPIVSTLLRGCNAAFFEEIPQGSDWADYRPSIYCNTIAVARTIAHDSDAIVPGNARLLMPDVEAGKLVLIGVMPAPALAAGMIFHLRGRTLSPSALLFKEEVRAECKAEAEFAWALAKKMGLAKQPVRREKRTGRTTRRPHAEPPSSVSD